MPDPTLEQYVFISEITQFLNERWKGDNDAKQEKVARKLIGDHRFFEKFAKFNVEKEYDAMLIISMLVFFGYFNAIITAPNKQPHNKQI